MHKSRPAKPKVKKVSKINKKIALINACRSPKIERLQAYMRGFLNANSGFFARAALGVSAALGAALLTPTHAQAPQNSDDFFITATRTQTKSDSVLAQTTVISREQITSAGHASLAQLLQRYAGVEIRSAGGPGQPSGIFIRGTNADHTLVLIDGVRVGSASNGTTAIEHIALDLIERIEVLKGGFSGLYGSDAIGGVIQIFTRGQKTPRLNAELNIGNKSTQGFNGGFSTLEGNTFLAFNVGVRKANAASATNARAPNVAYNPDLDAYSNTNVVLKAAHTFWQGETVAVQVWQSRGKTQFDAGTAVGNTNPQNQQTLGGAQLESSNEILPWWKSKFIAATTTERIDISSEFPTNFATKQNQLQWLNTLNTPVGTLLLGAEQNRQSLRSNINFDANARTINSVFANLLEQQDVQYLQANVRLDKFQLKQNSETKITTGQVAYGVKIWPEELVYSSVSRGYKLPSFNDLYYPGRSNPALKPERSVNAEVGYKYERRGNKFTPPLTVSAALFDNKIEDLIGVDATSSKPENLGLANLRRAHIRGMELAASGQWNSLDVRAAITAQQPVDAETKLQLRGRARVFGSLGVAKTIGKFSGEIDVVAVGKRFDSATEAPDSRLGGYATLNARLQYNITKQVSAEIVGSNLTNQPYENTIGYNTPRRQVMFNLKFSAQ